MRKSRPDDDDQHDLWEAEEEVEKDLGQVEDGLAVAPAVEAVTWTDVERDIEMMLGKRGATSWLTKKSR